ncbi:MAG: hypothetical protein IKX83_06915, partial [Clostridia bacterium]|nr:hypothetical protein [Clostridia bacterium]
DALDTVIREKQIHQENEFDFMFCIGQSFFSFLLKDENRRKLLLDLTASREITGEVLAFEYKWGVQFLAAEQTVPDQKFFDDVFVSMGGFYELLYRYLKDNKPFDLSTHLGRVIRTIMHDHGYSYDDAKNFVAAHHMTEDELETITSAVFQLMGL